MHTLRLLFLLLALTPLLAAADCSEGLEEDEEINDTGPGDGSPDQPQPEPDPTPTP